MAEGDVVHRAARRLDAALRGVPLTGASTPNARGRVNAAPERLVGRALERAEARGKHLLLRFGPDAIVHSHLGMRGAWHVYLRGERWRKPRRSAWLVLSTPSAHAVQFGGSRLALVDDARVRSNATLASLGPDVLASNFTPTLGAAALAAAGGERTLGEALLDQRVVAGIGNVYKSEACFAAGVSPWRPLAEVSENEVVRVCAEARSLMLEGVEGPRRATHVYRRASEPCPRCGTSIRRRAQGDAARATYWCPACQA